MGIVTRGSSGTSSSAQSSPGGSGTGRNGVALAGLSMWLFPPGTSAVPADRSDG
eukprot:CAMPEP_0204071342 /NCGR_PEP_ID=MMETSP0360-20130528/159929_1 /ASSEMBLY_ACC=CAM_ASM_000342 /TAXON_ID=268821 /ORGANISM="Scrippsiella Hangoei, Strain SHTV-5" /LENGTH=53 /DNA_ID=CAMNT_0051019615 /DNA_START=246 /DNA_END=407 /DNA_ORIENTATION=-